MRQEIAFFLSFTIMLLLSIPVFSQSGTLEVLDKDTNEPIAFASIVYTDLAKQKKHFASTDENGIVLNTLLSKSNIQIAFSGYKTLVDTLQPNISKTYYLEVDVFQLDQVVVTSTRTEKALKNAPVLTQVISSKQIEARGYQNITDVLSSDIPGLEIQQHGYGANINAQGLKPVNMLILVDGERLAGETRGNIDYSRLNAQDIDHIEIVKGAASALYGSQAMGAVINIITKKSAKKLYASVSSQYTSSFEKNYPNLSHQSDDYTFRHNLDRLNLTQHYTVGLNIGKWQSKTNYTRKTKDAYKLYDTEALAYNYTSLNTVVYRDLQTTNVDGLKDYTINQSLGYKATNKLEFKVNASYYNHDQYDYINDHVHDRYTDFNYTLKATYKPNTKSSYVLSWHDDRYTKFDYYEVLDSLGRNYQHHYINPKIHVFYQVNEKHEATGGMEFLGESLITDQFSSDRELDRKSISSSVLFLQDDITLSDRWNAIIGLRAEHHSSFGMHYSPKISVMYKEYPFTVRTNLASGYRSPNLKELYSDWRIPGLWFTIQGSDDLRPETNKYVSASFEYSKSKMNTSVNVYYNAFKDKIEGLFSNDQELYKYQNTKSASLFGIDYLVHYQPTNSWYIKAGYSYVKESRNEGVRISSHSPHTGSLQLGYSLAKKNYKLTTSLTGKYLGQKDAYDVGTINFGGEQLESTYHVQYEAYSMWRLSIQQTFKNYLQLTLGADNLFDYKPNTISFNTSITPGRTYFVGAKLDIEQLFY